jgi:hypothetical protein
MTTLKQIKTRFVNKTVEQIGNNQLFKVYNGFIIIYLSCNTIIAEYDQLNNELEINPTAFSRTTQKHKVIKKLHPDTTIKEMPL